MVLGPPLPILVVYLSRQGGIAKHSLGQRVPPECSHRDGVIRRHLRATEDHLSQG